MLRWWCRTFFPSPCWDTMETRWKMEKVVIIKCVSIVGNGWDSGLGTFIRRVIHLVVSECTLTNVKGAVAFTVFIDSGSGMRSYTVDHYVA